METIYKPEGEILHTASINNTEIELELDLTVKARRLPLLLVGRTIVVPLFLPDICR